MSKQTTHEPTRPVPSASGSGWRHVALCLLLVLTCTAPAWLLEESAPTKVEEVGR